MYVREAYTRHTNFPKDMTTALDGIRRHHLLGIWVDELTIPDLNRIMGSIVQSNQKRVIANHNLHSIYLQRRDPQMRAFFQEKASLIHADGMSLIFAAKALGIPMRRENRITYVDWVEPLMQAAARRQWRIFYLGSRPSVVRRGVKYLRDQHPNLDIGYHHGYFDAEPEGEENKTVVNVIHEFRPDVLMVGMGMPRQEKWIYANYDRLPPCAILTAGACIDYVAEAVPTPPRWMGRIGLEWLYRFFQEPRRLWYRHFVEPMTLLPMFFREIIRYRLLNEERRLSHP